MIGPRYQTPVTELKIFESSGSTELERKKILIVDDDNDTTDLLRIILETRDYEVFTANSGEQGINTLRSNAPDIMVIDLLMPDMDGMKVVQTVRKFCNIPILVVSALSRPNIVEQALDSGADDFIVKPMSSSVLVASINKLVRRSQKYCFS